MTIALAVSLIAGLSSSSAYGRAQTTLAQTIVDADNDNRLEPGPGERYLVRDELGTANPERKRTREELFFFGQLTDTHIVDEESPLRVEFLDRFGPPLTSAYRPQEGLSPQVVDSMVAQLRNTTSPLSGRRLQLAIATGDISDNTQLNETRWWIDLMDGRKNIDPNSGVPGTCGTTPDHLYDGVRGGEDYYEPDASGAGTDGRGYSPDENENRAERQRSVSVRDFPGLFEQMNRPFRATGIGKIPWYSVFGNHDALVQGNAPRNPVYEAIATGCVKVSNLDAQTAATIQALAAGGISAREQALIYKLTMSRAAAAAEDDPAAPSSVIVPSDPARRPLKKSEWMAEHCRTTGKPACHGFTRQNIQTGMGYYSFKPRKGIRFIVLDTISENGGDGGNIDQAQFEWLHETLKKADKRKELALLFAHHSLESMSQAPLSFFGVGDQGGDPNPLVHYGTTNSSGMTSECVITDPETPPSTEESLRCLLLRHPSAIAFVNGHEHNNRVNAWPRKDGQGKTLGGFWQINTASHIDWPQQSRTIEIVDNNDGNLSLFGTIIDHAAAPNPGGAPAPSEATGQASEGAARLASISRELSFNDPDGLNGEDGRSDARGAPSDRNVELIVRDPYAAG